MFPEGTKKTLCQSLVQSHLDYTISSWYAAIPQKAKNKLQILQNKIIRSILDLGPRTRITEEHMAELNILRIPGRVKQLRLNTAHKIFYNQAPTYLNANFKRARDRTQHTRRSQWIFIVPIIKGAEGNTFSFNAMKDWTSLPEQLKNCENIASFKKRGQETPDAYGNRGSRRGLFILLKLLQHRLGNKY